MSSFAHLHFHTQYSLHEGANHIKGLAQKLEEKNISACAITDHGNLFGIIEFSNELKEAGKHPIIGQGFSVVENLDTAFEKSSPEVYHLNLLCQNSRGYQNLIQLSSLGYLQGKFNEIPHIDYALLQKFSEGLIVLSGGIEGPIDKNLKDGKEDKAQNLIEFFCNHFRNRFYLEIARVGFSGEEENNCRILKCAERQKIPLVAVNPCFYPSREYAYPAHIHKLIGKKKLVKDYPQPETDQLYLRSPEEMKELFRDLPEAVTASSKIAETCQVNLENKKNFLPDFPTRKGLTIEEQIIADAKQGLEGLFSLWEKIGLYTPKKLDEMKPGYLERLDFELKTINSMNYSGYFLIVADFVRWAKNNGVSVGPGRGSGAGSIVAYALGITEIDPIHYDLIFERFLNPNRVSLPDFDIDFDPEKRERVIEYIRQKYGKDNVCQISTVGSLKTKAALRGVTRVLGISYGEGDKIVKMVPKTDPDKQDMTLTMAMEKEPLLAELFEEGSEQEKKLLRITLQVEGLNSNLSTHAAGIIIMNKKITDILPVCTSAKSGLVQSQFSMTSAEQQGAVKFDILGLKNLTLIDCAIKLIQDTKPNFSLRINQMVLDHPKVFKLLGNGQTFGVFQLESSDMRKQLVKFRPENFEEIIDIIALNRPGPMRANAPNDYIDRKEGSQFEYIHPSAKPFLKGTYGVVVYQEQVIRIVQVLAGFSLSEADLLRRAMGKKKKNELQKQEEKFVEGCLKNEIFEEKAREIFCLIEHFAGYGFNKSHSAAYALIAYQTAFLKALYPVEFITAMLNTESDKKEIPKILKEAKSMGIKILPPDIQKCKYEFLIEDGKIRYGLGGIKTLSREPAEIVLQMKKHAGKFLSMNHFYEQPNCEKIQVKAMENLICAGVFDSICKNRNALLKTCKDRLQNLKISKKQIIKNNFTLFDEVKIEERPDEETLTYVNEGSALEKLQKEKNLLGAFISENPLDAVGISEEKTTIADLIEKKSQLQRQIASTSLQEKTKKTESFNFKIVAYVSNLEIRLNKASKRYGYITLEDRSNSLELCIFADKFKSIEHSIEKDQFIYIDVSLNVYPKKRKNPKENNEPPSPDSESQKEKMMISLMFNSAESVFNRRINSARSLSVYFNDGEPFLNERLSDLKKFLQTQPGKTPVYLRSKNKIGEKICIRSKIHVNLSENFFYQIEHLIPLTEIQC